MNNMNITGNADWAAYTAIPACIIGIPSNIIVIAMVIFFKHLHIPFFTFIATISAANLIMVGLMVPFTMHGMLMKNIDNGLCQLIAHINWIGAGAAVLCILMLVLDRYFAIVWHKFYNKLGQCMLAIVITVSFVLPIVFLLPSVVQGNGKFHPNLLRCVISISAETSPVRNAFVAVIFIIPAIMILYCFLHILYHVKHKKKRILAGKEHDQNELMRLRKYFNEEARFANMGVVIVAYFIITYIPDAVSAAYERSGLAVMVHIFWLISAYGFAFYPLLYCYNDEILACYKQIFCVRQIRQFAQTETEPPSSKAIVKSENVDSETGQETENVHTVSGQVDISDVQPRVSNAETTL